MREDPGGMQRGMQSTQKEWKCTREPKKDAEIVKNAASFILLAYFLC